ncbi:MAG TPA: hypothetical protein VME46_25305 [Acidimicrobiales bacterium]|nr:hypothetical protein [Acidimicrobiales bacterium]
MAPMSFAELGLGALLAEGGEGRVFEVARAPRSRLGDDADLVYKQLRRPRPMLELEPMVCLPSVLAAVDPRLAHRARSSSAWPVAAVVGTDPGLGVGLVLPRAPGAFWLRHRDGALHLATLSYLAGDADRIAVAYGVQVPPPAAAERVALVYALCRLMAAWQAPESPVKVAHGDLSAKNVLWSLSPVPAVYVLDCDGSRVFSAAGDAYPDGGLGHLRATTPNWEDPAVTRGQPAGPEADRYLLGLIFLRLVGGAHFPVQARQRNQRRVSIDLELPRSWRHLPDMPGLWELCERSLSLASPADRPSPVEWARYLEQLLALLGASSLAADVRGAQDQGQGEPAWTVAAPAAAAGAAVAELAGVLSGGHLTVPDVVVRPLLRERAVFTWHLINARDVLAAGQDPLAGGGAGGAGPPAGLTPRQFARRTLSSWGAAHRLAVRLARAPGRRLHGARRMLGLLVIDIGAACAVIFLVAMVVSPWVGL